MEQFPTENGRRGAVAQRAHLAVRKHGARSASQVRATLRFAYRELLASPFEGDVAARLHYGHVLRVLDEPAFHDYAQSVLEWEALPENARRQRKDVRKAQFRCSTSPTCGGCGHE